MRLTSANKGADALAPHTEGRRYFARFDGDMLARDVTAATANHAPLPPGRRYRAVSPGEASIKWQRSPSGATHTGAAGDQNFVVMPDGRGAWILAEIDREGVSHLLEHSLPSDWSAMAAALDYVHTPIRWPLRVLVAGGLIIVGVLIHGLAAL